MKSENPWEKFFDHHASVYMSNVFTKNTLAEVDFIIEELNLQPGQSILDIGCGTGRHSVELARRGFRMTGVDQSEGMLEQARQKAAQLEVHVDWVKSNALDFRSPEKFDAAICICEGAFCLLGPDEDPIDHDLTILRNIHTSLKPGGRFLLNTLNALRMISQATHQDLLSKRVDPLTMTERNEITCDTPDGPYVLYEREHNYTPTELTMILRWAGFQVKAVWGGTAGNWSRQPVDFDEIELMASVVKP